MMTFDEYVQAAMKELGISILDTRLELGLAINYVIIPMSAEHYMIYGDSKPFEVSDETVINAIREKCGEDVFNRIFGVKSDDQ